MAFVLSKSTNILNPYKNAAVESAVFILQRDIKKSITDVSASETTITLRFDESLEEEQYCLSIGETDILITASDDLGFVYALLFISERYLGIHPFWFWLDQDIERKEYIEIETGFIHSEPYAVRFRGWFLNDEVLLMTWDKQFENQFTWKMAYEALLRCGGNMIIPGTDTMAKINREDAQAMGLYITHHHAEPLGAEMFARVYPDLSPSFIDHREEFISLWKNAIQEQKDTKIIWSLGFRGQGDMAFWEGSEELSATFDTNEKRANLMNEIIALQKSLVLEQVPKAHFCCNLYGEVMELYNEGLIHMDADIIKVWADNGYGKMCTRRRGRHDPRIPALPNPEDKAAHGTYYHVSFHDLQASGHLTTLPNTLDFVRKELLQAYTLGVDDFWLINSSNIRPHAYPLDFIRELWTGKWLTEKEHADQFAAKYYADQTKLTEQVGVEDISSCLQGYATSTLQYGKEEDQKAGEEFYAYLPRNLARQFIRDKMEAASSLLWISRKDTLRGQAEDILNICAKAYPAIERHFISCTVTATRVTEAKKQLFESTVLLQSRIHYLGIKGLIACIESILAFYKDHYLEAYVKVGDAASIFAKINQYMRASEYDHWIGFYYNDCFSDMKFTSQIMRSLRSYMRMWMDGPDFTLMKEQFLQDKADSNVRLLSTTENHMTDEELYIALKEKYYA